MHKDLKMEITQSESKTFKIRIVEFIWQHILLLLSMYVMTLGVALCVQSCLGSGVISAIPMAFAMAGADGLAPGLTIGGYTNIMNVILVGAQILVLRRRFEKVQLFQLVVGCLFGAMIDLNMALTSVFEYTTLPHQILAQLAGATILAAGVTAEIRCGSITMPGEGIQAAISRVSGWPFPRVKMLVDTILVVIAVACGYMFYGHWLWTVIGPGTLFAMFYVGYMVKVFNPHMGWFDRLLSYRPGFRRYVFGLARYIKLPGSKQQG